MRHGFYDSLICVWENKLGNRPVSDGFGKYRGLKGQITSFSRLNNFFRPKNIECSKTHHMIPQMKSRETYNVELLLLKCDFLNIVN